jgi:hypothetical protein
VTMKTITATIVVYLIFIISVYSDNPFSGNCPEGMIDLGTECDTPEQFKKDAQELDDKHHVNNFVNP